ncbi:MAG: enoyl-CoA hydratase/isomerase family protein [Desulfobacterales bacterium]|nr:MAG: enoyl-CoA hydratase/isomerase family protein [Desulfobacterales bacterium]
MERIVSFEFMRLEKEEKLAWVTFTREDHLNAMSNECTIQINRIAMALREDPDVRVAVIRGEGRAFSTGIDLKELAADRIEMRYHERWERALRIFETMEKLVIVGMHGFCLGGALQLALAADVRVSTADCQIGLPAIKESLIPGLATLRLPRYVGWGRAKKMILGGQNISGDEALQIGLVDHIVSDADFFKQLDKVAGDYLAACSVGTRMSKLAINKAFDMDFDPFLQYYYELQERAQFSGDADEAKRAYLEKRAPIWQ